MGCPSNRRWQRNLLATPEWKKKNRQLYAVHFRQARERLLDRFRRLNSPEEMDVDLKNSDSVDQNETLCQEYLDAMQNDYEWTLSVQDKLCCPQCQKNVLQAFNNRDICSSCGFTMILEKSDALKKCLEEHSIICSRGPSLVSCPATVNDPACVTVFCDNCDLMEVIPHQ
ncbi:hypothetical protein CHUAL_006768 [Chamberlinius hualienensis]